MIYTKGFLKKFIIASLATSLVFGAGCGTKEAKEPPKYFEITADELVNELASEWLIELKLDRISNVEGSYEESASYTFRTENDTAKTEMNYHITYDSITNKISYIYINVNKEFMGDVKSALARYYYHTGTIAQIIDANANIDEIRDTISIIASEPGTVSLYKGEKFNILANSTDYSFSASFHSK